jgi:hypothetical protein
VRHPQVYRTPQLGSMIFGITTGGAATKATARTSPCLPPTADQQQSPPSTVADRVRIERITGCAVQEGDRACEHQHLAAQQPPVPCGDHQSRCGSLSDGSRSRAATGTQRWRC